MKKFFDHAGGKVTAIYAKKQYKGQSKASNVKLGDLWDGTNITPGNQEAEAERKSKRKADISKITVTVDAMVFDGCEKSQSRLLRKIQAAKNDAVVVDWILADDSVSPVTIRQLKTVLEKADAKQQLLMVPPANP